MSATPSPGKHHNIVKIVKNKKITLFPQPVTYRGKLAPKDPYENEKDVQRSYISVETLLFTPNVLLGICLEQMLTHVWHLRKQYKTKTNKNVIFFVFVFFFQSQKVEI